MYCKMRIPLRLPAALLIPLCFCSQIMARVDPTCKDCVQQNLASLRMKLGASKYREAQSIVIFLILKAGSKGVYLPAYFGEFLATCQNGFAVALLTRQGTQADPTVKGCAASQLHSGSDTALDELHSFVYLKPGEERTWRTELPTIAVKPGTYYLIGEYISSAYMIQEVARLPQVNGLMAMGRIDSKRIKLRITR